MTALPPNPKQAFGDLKPNLALVPPAFSVFTALALENGAAKYGAFNWRQKAVEAMTYVAACKRHLDAWADREANAPDSGLPHLGHAAASLAILVDCLTIGNLIDNRPPAGAVSRIIEEIAAERKAKRDGTASVQASASCRCKANPIDGVYYDCHGADDCWAEKVRDEPKYPAYSGPSWYCPKHGGYGGERACGKCVVEKLKAAIVERGPVDLDHAVRTGVSRPEKEDH